MEKTKQNVELPWGWGDIHKDTLAKYKGNTLMQLKKEIEGIDEYLGEVEKFLDFPERKEKIGKIISFVKKEILPNDSFINYLEKLEGKYYYRNNLLKQVTPLVYKVGMEKVSKLLDILSKYEEREVDGASLQVLIFLNTNLHMLNGQRFDGVLGLLSQSDIEKNVNEYLFLYYLSLFIEQVYLNPHLTSEVKEVILDKLKNYNFRKSSDLREVLESLINVDEKEHINTLYKQVNSPHPPHLSIETLTELLLVVNDMYDSYHVFLRNYEYENGIKIYNFLNLIGKELFSKYKPIAEKFLDIVNYRLYKIVETEEDLVLLTNSDVDTLITDPNIMSRMFDDDKIGKDVAQLFSYLIKKEGLSFQYSKVWTMETLDLTYYSAGKEGVSILLQILDLTKEYIQFYTHPGMRGYIYPSKDATIKKLKEIKDKLLEAEANKFKKIRE